MVHSQSSYKEEIRGVRYTGVVHRVVANATDGQPRAAQRLDRRLQSDSVVGDQQSSEHSLVQGKLRCPRKHGVCVLLLFVGHASLLTTLTAALTPACAATT